nr:LLM class flavin-dependent oxidoreductase [Mycolicibacterium phlei]
MAGEGIRAAGGAVPGTRAHRRRVPGRDRRTVDGRIAALPRQVRVLRGCRVRAQTRPEAAHGKYVSFEDVAFEPNPAQKPHLPIWIGGDSDAALRRAAKYASGWWSFLTPPEKIAERVEFIKSQPGYDGRPFDVVHGLGTTRVGEGHTARDDPNARPGMSAAEIVDRLGWLAEQGVTVSAVPLPPVSGVDEYLDYAQWVIEVARDFGVVSRDQRH